MTEKEKLELIIHAMEQVNCKGPKEARALIEVIDYLEDKLKALK